jgi:hypothetical protein
MNRQVEWQPHKPRDLRDTWRAIQATVASLNPPATRAEVAAIVRFEKEGGILMLRCSLYGMMADWWYSPQSGG